MGPGLALEGGLLVATIVELSKNASGRTAPSMRRLTWVLLTVTVLVNASGEDTGAKMLLHGVIPVIWKVGAIGGLKTLLLDLADVTMEDRLPVLRWLQAPVSTAWCWRQRVLGRVPTYEAAMAIDLQVAVRDIDLRAQRAETGQLRRWQRRPSARDLALRDALTNPPAAEPKRRPAPKTPTKTATPVPRTAPAAETTSSRPATEPVRPTPGAVLGGTTPGPVPEGDQVAAAATVPLRLTVPTGPAGSTETPANESAMRVGALEAGFDQDLDTIENWLAEHGLNPTGDNVADAARAKQLPYAKRSVALEVAKELKQRRAVAS